MSTENSLNTDQVFSDISKAIKENDQTKLKELTTGEATEPVKTAEVVETKPVVEEKSKEEVKAVEEVKTVAAAEGQGENKEEVKQQPKPFDWIESLPDGDQKEQARTLLSKFKQAETDRRVAKQAYKSNAGRVAAYQRTVMELKAKLSERPQVDVTAASTDEDLQTLIENDPKLAAYLQKREKALLDGVTKGFEQRLDSIVQPLIKGQEQQADNEISEFVQGQQAILRQYVPNVDEVVKHDTFRKWASEEATPGQRALIDSPNWEDGYTALQLYSDYLVSQGHIQRQPTPVAADGQAAKTEVASPNKTSNEVADKVAASRDRKSNTTGVASSSTASIPVSKGEVVDPEALFKKYSEDLLKSRQRR